MRCQKHDERSYGRMLIATAHPPFDLAEHAVGRDDDVVEEHLGELVHAVDHLERCDRDPGRVHVDEERGDAPMARFGWSGAREQHAAVGVLREARPDLLPVDHPRRRGARVAVGIGAAAQRREVAAGAGLGEALAPQLGAGQQPRHDVGGELRRRVVDERRREDLDEREQPGIGQVARRDLRAELGAQHRRATEPADPFGPSPAHPVRVVEERLDPLHLRDVVVERAREPRTKARARRRARRATELSSERKSAMSTAYAGAGLRAASNERTERRKCHMRVAGNCIPLYRNAVIERRPPPVGRSVPLGANMQEHVPRGPVGHRQHRWARLARSDPASRTSSSWVCSSTTRRRTASTPARSAAKAPTGVLATTDRDGDARTGRGLRAVHAARARRRRRDRVARIRDEHRHDARRVLRRRIARLDDDARARVLDACARGGVVGVLDREQPGLHHRCASVRAAVAPTPRRVGRDRRVREPLAARFAASALRADGLRQGPRLVRPAAARRTCSASSSPRSASSPRPRVGRSTRGAVIGEVAAARRATSILAGDLAAGTGRRAAHHHHRVPAAAKPSCASVPTGTAPRTSTPRGISARRAGGCGCAATRRSTSTSRSRSRSTTSRRSRPPTPRTAR